MQSKCNKNKFKDTDWNHLTREQFSSHDIRIIIINDYAAMALYGTMFSLMQGAGQQGFILAAGFSIYI